jgi:two-component system, OmpR family, response regulator
MTMQAGKTVLLVDDDQDFVIQQKAALERLGFTVTTAFGREEAVAALEHLQPDLAIVDLMMDEMDGGFVLAHQIKARYPGTPVVMVTAVTGETGLRFGQDGAGQKRWIKADALLAKPVRFEQLEREIERVMA